MMISPAIACPSSEDDRAATGDWARCECSAASDLDSREILQVGAR